MNTINIKKGDTAVVISGKEKGKQAKVLRVEPTKNKVVLEGTNMLTKHKKPKNQTTPGGIIKQEGSLNASNVMVVCPNAIRPRGSVIKSKTAKSPAFAKNAALRCE